MQLWLVSIACGEYQLSVRSGAMLHTTAECIITEHHCGAYGIVHVDSKTCMYAQDLCSA